MAAPAASTTARTITYDEQIEMGLLPAQDRSRSRFVAPAPQDILPSRHEIVDPYAPTYPHLVQHLVRREHDPITRARSMLIKTSTVTVFLSILTAAAMLMLDSWSFLAWLLLASLEWVCCFVLLAILDWRETPSALAWKMSGDYKGLMEREQRARLKRLYGYEEMH